MIGIVNCVFTIPALLYLDKFGRRKLLMVGALTMCGSQIVLAGIMGKYDGDFAANKGAGLAGAFFLFVSCVEVVYVRLDAWDANVPVLHCKLLVLVGPHRVGVAR